jgi:hypothetical protein
METGRGVAARHNPPMAIAPIIRRIIGMRNPRGISDPPHDPAGR